MTATEVLVHLTDAELATLDAAVVRGRFASRSDALRASLERILREECECEIDEAYARGYAKHPQEEWIGVLGLGGLASLDKAEGDERL